MRLLNWFLCVISGFRHEVGENCALLGCYTANSAKFLPMFRNYLSVPYSWLLNPEDGTDRLSETSVINFHYSLRNNPEESNFFFWWRFLFESSTFTPVNFIKKGYSTKLCEPKLSPQLFVYALGLHYQDQSCSDFGRCCCLFRQPYSETHQQILSAVCKMCLCFSGWHIH
jgi:hypothetical protein